jgi:hypothetical protein
MRFLEPEQPMPQLDREEYIEQAYFWKMFLERIADGVPAQEVIVQVGEEILSTTRLPMALDFLAGELRHKGLLSDGMSMMSHYFAPFQAFLMRRAEDETAKFDLRIALQILQHEAEYRATEDASPSGLFLFLFECLARNRLGYHDGIQAIADDSMFDAGWRQWMLWVRQQLGAAEFCEFLYMRSEFAVEEKRRSTRDPDWKANVPILFGVREGRIAKANRGKDPLYMFAALQRQLGYPAVPRPDPKDNEKLIHPVIEDRLQLLEKRLTLVEQELKEGGIDLTEFYKRADVQDG